MIKEDEVLTLLDAVEFIRQLRDYELDVRKIGTNEFPKFRFKKYNQVIAYILNVLQQRSYSVNLSIVDFSQILNHIENLKKEGGKNG